MGLASTYLISPGRVPDFFNQIKDGQAPERFTQQLLKDWGFASTNDRALIPLLKALGFLTPEGKPTERYSEYRDHSKSAAVLGEAIKDAYGDLFLIKSNPSDSDKDAIKGKFKSFHNTSDNVAGLMTRTFFALLSIADINSNHKSSTIPSDLSSNEKKPITSSTPEMKNGFASGLHYNIQIHLPPTKDIEVYNAIFKSLRTHLVEE